ncbi:glycosyltransferase [Microbacterium xylanilyticum]
MATTGKDPVVGTTAGTVLAHDYLTQRGGAERVALSLARAFPGAPLHTTLYEPGSTFPEFADVDVRPLPINRWRILRRHHRLALPFLEEAVSRHTIEADVLVASSSGWAHGMATTGRKVVYCHAPARWLYQTDRYAEGAQGATMRSHAVRLAERVLGSGLREWDQRAAHTADRYLVNSTVVKRAVAEVYGIDAEVLPPPPAPLALAGTSEPMPGVEQPFLLCVARLLPYKNVDVVIEAVAELPGLGLVVVGDGPERARLQQQATRAGSTVLAGRVSDAQLRWLYANCAGLVAASYEDFGLSPLEAATFGKPTAALHDGGYLDTVVEGATGVFFERPDAEAVATALDGMTRRSWDADGIATHAETFSEQRFIARIRDVVRSERALG